ncbi:pilus assembly protein PilP [Geoalkalibacter sp.]|uniref:pilus assembly protein PilP n=1 Tax=Geoalkalibacter sp. TaxID=3041440 RepID=UPI00272E78B8|nr:pilus assembly protein PilP [Geoalkalibacter sp.]
MPTRVLCALMLGAALLLTAGCGEEPAPPPQAAPPAPRPAPAPAPPAATEPVIAEEPAPAEAARYVYNPVGKRDPFQSLLDIRKPVATRAEPKTPLEQFDLDQMRLVGSIVGMAQPRAMLMAPDGKSYIVRVGTKLGKNNGVVVAIEKDRIVVEERFYDFADEVRTSRQSIELPKREGV